MIIKDPSQQIDLQTLPAALGAQRTGATIHLNVTGQSVASLIQALQQIETQQPGSVVHDPETEAEAQASALLADAALQAEDLDELVHEDFGNQAASVNNGGVRSQVTHLLLSGFKPGQLFSTK